MLVPIVKRRIEYYTEMYDVVEFLKHNEFEIARNAEEGTYDIRMNTVTASYTHYVAHIYWRDVDPIDNDWIRLLRADNRLIEFIEKYQEKIHWAEHYRACVINSIGEDDGV